MRDLRLIFGMVERRGTQFFDQRQQADDQRAPADQQDSRDENERDPAAQPAEHVEDESVGAHQQPFAVGQRRHHLRARLAEQIGDGNELVALGAQAIDDLRQRRHGVAAVAAAVVHQDDVAVAAFVSASARAGRSCRTGARRLAVGLAPIVRIDPRADDHVAHGLRDGKHLNFAGRFRLVVDAVRRTEQRGLHAESAFEQQLGEIQFQLKLRLRDRARIPDA